MKKLEQTCDSCHHFLGTEEIFGRTAYRCRLTSTLLTGKPCELYNKDISSYELCINCKHFLGGGDWGLACRKHYRRLPEALDKACDDMEWKEGSKK